VSDRLARFYGMITHVDEQLGRLRSQLEAWGLAENAIFIFMTDNRTAGRDYLARVERAAA
jgi:arylsulfatase A-like enzyme